MSTPAHTAVPASEVDRWTQIDHTLQRLTRLARTDIAADPFHEQMLADLITVSGAPAGAFWRESGRGELQLGCQQDLDRMGASHRDELLASLTARRDGVPSDGVLPSDAGSVVYRTISVSGRTVGVLELLVAGEDGSAAVRGGQHLLEAAGEIAADYHREREVRDLRRQEDFSQALAGFAQQLIAGGSPADWASLVANETRRLTGCDRVVVLLRSGRSFRLSAVSGTDSPHRLAGLARPAIGLASLAASSGELLTSGRSIELEQPASQESASQSLESPVPKSPVPASQPAELTRLFQEYLDHAAAHRLIAVALPRARDEDDDAPEVQAVVICETYTSEFPARFDDRLERVCELAAPALTNVVQHAQLPLGWLVRSLAAARRRLRTVPRLRTILFAAVTALVVAVLLFGRATYMVRVPGELQPAQRRHIFAPADGIVQRIDVEHGQTVMAGQPLAALRSPELDYEIHRVDGEIQALSRQLDAIRETRLTSSMGPRTRSHQITAELEELKERLRSLQQQRQILEDKRTKLTICAPMDGQVTTWDVRRRLESRPIRRGQILMDVGDTGGNWVLELKIPHREIGRVIDAQRRRAEPLSVRFLLETDTGQIGTAQLEMVAESASVTAARSAAEVESRFVSATATFDRSVASRLRAGAGVQAKIDCGDRAVGYVWFHDLIDFVSSRVLF